MSVPLIIAFYAQGWSYEPELTGQKYQAQLAKDKLQQIQNKINQGTTKPDSYPLFRLAVLFIQDNNLAFNTVGDEMPVQGIFPMKGKRDKLIHSVGIVAQCKFESNGNHNYTGVFKGVDNAFVRFSVANQPEKKENYFAPGFAFKFLRDGLPSANIFAMYSLDGQTDSSNIFHHDMTSDVPMLNSDAALKLKLLKRDFYKSSDYPVYLGLSNAAYYDQKGRFEQDAKFPYRLQLHPTQEAKNSMSGDLEISDYFFIDALKGKQIENLFDVYAQAEPQSELQLIGSIKMTTPFDSSDYGDQKLFFQHQLFEDDLEIRPEWRKPTEDLISVQENTFPQYHYPDIQ